MFHWYRVFNVKRFNLLLSRRKVCECFFESYSKPTLLLDMNEALLLHEDGNPKFEMKLRYIDPKLNVDRHFHFQRNVDESLNKFLSRINNNITSYMMKKAKRIKSKRDKDSPETVIERITEMEKNMKFIRDNTVLDGELTCKEILENTSAIKLIIFDTEYILKQNVPYINKIELPCSILVNFPTYPSKLEGTHVDKKKSTFNWYRGQQNKWSHVGQGYLYIPKRDDLGFQLKLICVPKNDTQCGPTVEIISDDVVHAGPERCPFDARHAFTKKKLSGKSFRVTSYNILANVYSETVLSKETLYPYCPPHALTMAYRRLLILKELIGFNSDVICLQEVDGKVYENDLLTSLSEMNYDSVYNSKNDLQEGLAIFYDRNRFDKLISDCSVMSQDTELDEFKDVWNKLDNDKVKQTFLNRNTVVQTAVLRSKENPQILIVGNTHLYFRPDADHIRLLQAYYGLLYLQKFSREMKEQYPECDVSILYCGDFNSTPDNAVYELMTQKCVPDNHSDWKSCEQEQVENICVKHDLNFSSACGTPPFTNYTAAFAGCLDYIFYQTDCLDVEQIIPLPSEKELSTHTALPSVVCPSDHISLCADLKWIK